MASNNNKFCKEIGVISPPAVEHSELLTLSGSRHRTEPPDQLQVTGSCRYEPVELTHDQATATEPVVAAMAVHGVNFDNNGDFLSIMDASDITSIFDALAKERGMEPARYIRARLMAANSKLRSPRFKGQQVL